MDQQILLKPTGPYTVGISRFDLHDENRLEIYADPYKLDQ